MRRIEAPTRWGVSGGSRIAAVAALLLLPASPAFAQPYVYVANLGAGTVSVLDAPTDRLVATLPVGEDPDGVAVSPDGTRVYVTNFVSGTLTIIDAASNTVVTTVPVGDGPVGVAVAADGATAYVTNRGADAVAVVDTASAAVRTVVPVGDGPDAIALTPDGRTAYVTNSFTGLPGQVSVLDLSRNAVRGTVLVHRAPNRVAVSPDGTRAYVTNFRGWNLSVVDTATDTVVDAIRVTRKPTSVAVNPNGASVYVTTLGYPDFVEGNVHIIDAATNRVTNSLLAGVDARALVAERRGGTGYVANFGGDSVTVLDLADELVLGEIAVGSRPFALAVNCVGSGCTAPPYTPKPTRAATDTPTVAVTPTRTPPPSATPATVVPAAFLQVSSASGRPGDHVAVTVRLDARGHRVAGVQNDIVFDSAVAVAARANGRPDCSVNPAIDKPATSFRFQPSDCLAGACAASRALVLALDNSDPIPDGSVLYTCQIAIATNAAPGAHVLGSSNVGAGTPEGEAIATGVVDGTITVLGATMRQQDTADSSGARLCSAGERDGLPCDTHTGCPGGACATAQGVCDGGADDGLLCDCPGGTCAAAPACSTDPQRGTCRGGARDGECCERTFNCGDGAACAGSHRLCANGPSKGMPCLDEHHCVGAACIATGRLCAAGAFDGTSCIDDGDCPRGACVTPTPALPAGQPCSGNDAECASNHCGLNFICCREACNADAPFCDNNGDCQVNLANGNDCQADNECQSNVCDAFDGICCNRRCDILTEVCVHPGICGPLPGSGTPGSGIPTPTPDLCGACPPGTNCIDIDAEPLCIPNSSNSSSGGGGCAIGGAVAVDGNLAVVALLPIAFWISRRWQRRHRST